MKFLQNTPSINIYICSIFLLFSTNGYSQGFGVTMIADNTEPHGFCDIVTINMNITNDGAASTFTGRIEYNQNDFSIIDVSDLSGNTSEVISPDVTYIHFNIASIGMTQSADYEFKVIVKAYSSFNFVTEATITRTSDSGTATTDEHFQDAVDYFPLYGIASVSEIMEATEIANSLLSLYPVEPLEINGVFACDENLGQSIYIDEALIVDVPEYCFYNGNGTGRIIIGEGGRIVVKDGATLIIDNVSLRSCHKMWEGFYVEKGGTLALNNCIIANAQYGINAERGAIIKSVGTTFLDNYVGFYIDPHTYALDPEAPEDSYVDPSPFYNNVFIGSGTMLPPYTGQTPPPSETKPFAGISINNVSLFSMSGGIVGDNAYVNYFENLQNGIVARGASLQMGDSFFKDIVNDSPNDPGIEGYGVYIQNGKYSLIYGNTIGFFEGNDHHFENCSVGIYNSEGGIYVDGVTMNNVETGIHARNVLNRTLKITSNKISASKTGILLNHCNPKNGLARHNELEVSGDNNSSAGIEINDYPVPTNWLIEFNEVNLGDGKYGIIHRSGYNAAINNNTINVNPYTGDEAYGIYLEGSKYTDVSCNLLTGDIDGTNYHFSRGIYTTGADGFAISCNDISEFRFGINHAGFNRESLLRGNTINSQWDGLLLGRYPDDGNVVIGRQTLSGNLWPETYHHYGAVHYGPSELIQESRFIVDSGDDIDYLPPSILSATQWLFDIASVEDNFDCEEANSCPEGIGVFTQTPFWTPLDKAVIAGDLAFEYFERPLSWTGRFQVFHRLDGSGISLPTEISTYVSNNQNLNTGKFSRAIDSLYSGISYSGYLENNLDEFPDEVYRLFTDIRILDSILFFDGYNSTLFNLSKSKKDSIFLLECIYLEEDTIINTILSSRLSNAITDIEAITPDSIWETHLKFVLLEAADLVSNGILSSSGDLYELANNCPDRYGDAVYMARSLLRRDSVINYFDDSDLCTTLFPRSVEIEEQSQINLYPNPTTYTLNISSTSTISRIEIYSLAGILLKLFPEINNTITLIDISFLPPGIYFGHSILGNGKTEIRKFVVLNN